MFRFIIKHKCLSIIAFLILVIIAQNIFGGKKKERPIQNVVVLPSQKITLTSNIYEPKIIVVNTTTTNEKWKIKYKTDKGDSLRIIETYKKLYAENAYKDTVVHDTNAMVIVTDTVSENKIMKRSVYYEVYPHTYYVKVKAPPRIKVYVGLGTGGYADKFGLAGKAMLIDKKDHPYTISYNPIIKYVEVSTFWKIKFK